MKKRISDYEDYLEIFNYHDIPELKKVLRNFLRLQELAESSRGISNATVILADISKAMTCIVDDYDCITQKQYESLYYAYFCGLPYKDAAEFVKIPWWTVRREADKAIKKLLYVLGEETNGEERKGTGEAGKQNPARRPESKEKAKV